MSDFKALKRAADTVRILSAEAIQKAKSGHPGMPMGTADIAMDLWFSHMRHNPKNPLWLGRDRFILSAGHGSMLLYSLLHLFQYGLTMEDLKQFRQWGSLTPGHPEFGHTRGVEVTTGPLGSGFASAIGMAIAQKRFGALTGLTEAGLLDSKIFIISGDGCMMEGTTHEAASFAGNQKLDNVIVFYDDNKISIEGSTGITFTEDVAKRYEAYGWRVLRCDNGNDIAKVDAAIIEAKKSDGRPTFVVFKTAIGFGSPNKAGKASAHGEPLGPEELAATKAALGFPADEFTVPAEVSSMMAARVAELEKEAAAWDAKYQKFIEAHPEKAKLISALLNREVPADIDAQLKAAAPIEKPMATRASGGVIIQKVSELVPSLWGGSADLSPSTKTNIKGAADFNAEDRTGKNIHFGVRELGMGMMANGMALTGAFIPYTSTFFTFSDYMKPAIRLACIQKLHEIYVFTHDSFYVGEDGPTHEPVEQLAMLRTIPGMTVLRPAEAFEVAAAWAYAVKAEGPVAIILTRQDLAPYSAEMANKIDMAKGAYVVDSDADYEYCFIATGSEVNLSLEAAKLMRAQGKKVRVVSMPSCELFMKQDKAYRDSVICPCCSKRITVEAGSTFGWDRFAGEAGLKVGIDFFGASAPYKVLAEKYGFKPELLADKVLKFFA